MTVRLKCESLKLLVVPVTTKLLTVRHRTLCVRQTDCVYAKTVMKLTKIIVLRVLANSTVNAMQLALAIDLEQNVSTMNAGAERITLYRPIKRIAYQVIATSLNSQCTEELQCSRLVNSRCWGGACICKDHTFQSSNTACEVKRCQSNSCDYLGYAVCVAGGTCQCNANGFQYGTRCYRSIIGKVGDKCTNDDLCHLNADGANQHVSCTKGKCTCNKPYKPNKEKTSCSGAAGTFISITTALLAVVAAMQA
ncbi:Protein of unknown function [Gryllus bimaculatus]|nr:Protein of unknown function [Gryllus bimaculatus]